MAAIFFNKVYKTYIFYVEKLFECFISNLKLVLAYIFFQKYGNKSSQNRDTGYHYIKYGGGGGGGGGGGRTFPL